jgi:LCP family protein required for cell wall assembly
MLSIPRDLWVNIPGFDYYKINQAYYFGELNKLPGGGPGLAMETVRQLLGVNINYYAQIDFDAFVLFIDEIKGVKILVEEPLSLTTLGTNKHVNLEPGWVTLPGDIALAYARYRYTEGGDFDRASRQQQVIMGVRDRILSFEMLPTLITRAPVLYNQLSKGIRTNMSLEQIVRLAWLAQGIPAGDIKQTVIGPNEVDFGMSPDGQDILQPYPDKIRLLRDEIFATGGPVGPVAVAEDPKELMTAESARVSVQNGSSEAGLAGRTSEWLRAEGINVVEETNAGELYGATTVFIYNGKPYTVRYLSQIMGIDNLRVYNRFDPNAAYDIALVLGDDWSADNTLP